MSRKSSLTRFCMGCSLVLVVIALAGTDGAAQTTSQSQADKKTPAKKPATPPKKDDSQAEERLETLVLARLKEQFKKQDINSSGGLEKAELITWFGLVKGPDLLKKFDKDGDGKLTAEEFEEWAAAYADAYAKEMIEEQKEAEEELAKLQKAYAKASADAKAQYQKAIQRQRDQVERLRDRQEAERRRQRQRQR